MKCIIQAESHRVELAGVYLMEHDDEVLEYYDQPPSIQLSYTSQTNRLVTVRHTPDFFVLREDWIGWEEWKKEEELAILAERMPNRYQRSEAGTWHCPPGETYAAEIGLQYRVCTPQEINWILLRNLQFLDDYWRGDSSVTTHPMVTDGMVERIIELVSDKLGATLTQLITAVGHLPGELSEGCKGNAADWVHHMIAHEQLYVDSAKHHSHQSAGQGCCTSNRG
jgi:putative transposase